MTQYVTLEQTNRNQTAGDCSIDPNTGPESLVTQWLWKQGQVALKWLKRSDNDEWELILG
jgi:hypothetical protein